MILIEIIPNVWLGDTIGEQYKNNANIKYVVNCVKDLAFLNSYQEYRGEIRDSLDKYQLIKVYEYLLETTNLFTKCFK